MRNLLKVLAVAVLVALPLLSFGQKTLKFGHFNSQEIIQAMPERDSAQVKLQKYQKTLEDQLEVMQVEYNNKLQDYMKIKDSATDLIKKTKEEELGQYQQRIQQFQENAQTELRQKQEELMQPIADKIKKAINDLGKDNGFIYIFDLSSNTIQYHSSESQDVTAMLKAKLNIKK
jgi:outer membrane protein